MPAPGICFPEGVDWEWIGIGIEAQRSKFQTLHEIPTSIQFKKKIDVHITRKLVTDQIKNARDVFLEFV